MSDIVFILGAGASRQAGAPLMSDFLDKAADLLVTGRVNKRRIQFEKVFSAIGGLQQVHSKAQLDLNNIESVFTAFELAKIIQRLPGVPTSEIPEVIAALKQLIVSTLERTMQFPVSERDVLPPKPYGEFASFLGDLQKEQTQTTSVSVITFNYDIAIDLALVRAGFEVSYSLTKHSKHRTSMDLLKLHGSLNWAEEHVTKKIIPVALSSYLREPYALTDTDLVYLTLSEKFDAFFGCQSPQVHVKPEAVIVPPSWNKADYHHALSDIWAAAAEHLAAAQHIFIVGYSLPETDAFFRHLFALGCVGPSPLRSIVVFNPDSSVDGRFQSLLGPGALARYQFHPITFEEAIKHLRKSFKIG